MIGANEPREGDETIEHELELADDEESLPWLDSDYEEEEAGGYDTGRLIGVALLGLLLIAVGFAGYWFYSNRSGDSAQLADGSTIEAPGGPVKERPEDAGGRTFEGTGNVAPAVGEGQTREGRLAEGKTARPSIAAAGSRADDGGTASSAQASGGGPAVQVGAYLSRETAEAAWGTLNRQTDKLAGLRYRVEQGQVDGSTVYRLQAVTGDLAAARALCTALKADGLACQVKP